MGITSPVQPDHPFRHDLSLPCLASPSFLPQPPHGEPPRRSTCTMCAGDPGERAGAPPRLPASPACLPPSSYPGLRAGHSQLYPIFISHIVATGKWSPSPRQASQLPLPPAAAGTSHPSRLWAGTSRGSRVWVQPLLGDQASPQSMLGNLNTPPFGVPPSRAATHDCFPATCSTQHGAHPCH